MISQFKLRYKRVQGIVRKAENRNGKEEEYFIVRHLRRSSESCNFANLKDEDSEATTQRQFPNDLLLTYHIISNVIP